MTIFNRKISLKLSAWQQGPERRPLIIRGARQVGKSFAVRAFGKLHYDQLLEINFEQQPSYKKFFTKDLDPKFILSELELKLGKAIRPGQDLLFFDEVQECPQAITALRYFYEQAPEYHIIAAGSLLEFALDRISVPVGRVDYEYMYPMCFSEFLAATGRAHLIEYIPNLTTVNVQPSRETATELLFAAMKEYFIVGGMPAVVAAYTSSKSFLTAGLEQERILRTFKDDIHKYASGSLQTANLEKLLESSLKHVGKQIKYTTLSSDVDTKRTKLSVELLERACLLTKVCSVNPSGLPLGAEASDKIFKLIFLDIGLGQKWAGFSPSETIESENLLSLYEGRLAEQFVGQQLLAESVSASEDRSLYCWIRTAKSSNAEVDYLIVRDGKIIGIEVKSGKSGSLRSLHVLKEKYPNIKKFICVQQTSGIQTVHDITFMPLFSVL